MKERTEEETVFQLKQGFVAKNNALPEIKETKRKQLSTEIMKIHVNAGKKTKMRPVDIVG
ncbi:MAG: hypothetical protein APF81_23365 [Desulfosporosinus sp. BRH_c37]|nr:MAG: hypothetical protein APF81_23365 [Desulfosporosinus sp. BRH_c37]